MKLQDVILKAMAKKISWLDAAEIIGVSDRTMRRMREQYVEYGYTGLMDRRKGKQSVHRVPMEIAEEVLRLYREVYFDLNMRHFHEKLREEHKIELSYTWVQQALQGAGLVAKRRACIDHDERLDAEDLRGYGRFFGLFRVSPLTRADAKLSPDKWLAVQDSNLAPFGEQKH